MTKKELEQQAKEYGYTVEQIKEFRKHLKPFLRFAIKELKRVYKSGKGNTQEHYYLCFIINSYAIGSDQLCRYLKKRLEFAAPIEQKNQYAWGFKTKKTNEKIYAQFQLSKKIEWCKQQLKIVKP